MLVRRLKLLIFILCVIPLLNGCRVVWFEESKDEEFDYNPDKEITIDSKVQIYRNKLMIRGESNLPEGAILEFNLKPYQEEATAFQVETYAVEPEDKISASGTSKIGEGGTIEGTFVKRPDDTKRYRLEVVFDPRKQTENIQQSYGPLGESIALSDGIISLTDQSIKVTVIKKYVNLLKSEEPNGMMANLNFTSLKK